MESKLKKVLLVAAFKCFLTLMCEQWNQQLTMWVYLFCLTYKAKWAKTLMTDAKINRHMNSQLSLNPLSPNGDQHLLPNSLNTFFNKM